MADWLTSMWDSVDRLSYWITVGNVGIALSIFATFSLTAFVVVAGVRKDALQKLSDSKKDEIIAQTNQLAATANLQSSEANVKLGVSLVRQKELDVQIHQALIEQEQLRAKNLELQSQLEKDRTARLQLEAQVGFRTINKQQRDLLIVAFQNDPKATVSIRAPNSSNESSQFAEKLREIFIASGWNANPVFYNMVAGAPVDKGVVMVVRSERSLLGALVQKTFMTVGIEFKGLIDPKLPENAIVVIVGQKP